MEMNIFISLRMYRILSLGKKPLKWNYYFRENVLCVCVCACVYAHAFVCTVYAMYNMFIWGFFQAKLPSKNILLVCTSRNMYKTELFNLHFFY